MQALIPHKQADQIPGVAVYGEGGRKKELDSQVGRKMRTKPGLYMRPPPNYLGTLVLSDIKPKFVAKQAVRFVKVKGGEKMSFQEHGFGPEGPGNKNQQGAAPPAVLPTPLGSDSWLGLHSH